MILDAVRIVVAVALTGLLAWACYWDFTHRRLPNLASILALALFAPWAFTGGIGGLLGALAAFAVAGLLTFAMYLFKIIGAGDCKLFTCLALFAGWPLLPHYAVLTALSGGAVAAAYIAANPTKNYIVFLTRGEVPASRGVPYGFAIAAGALVVVWLQAIGKSALLIEFLRPR